MKKHKIDVFLSPDSFVSLKSDVPTIDVIHDIAFEHHPEFIESSSQRKYLLNYTKKFALKSDHIATVSEYTKQDIIQTYGIEADKISVVYNGANTNYKALSELEKQAVREAYTEGQPYFIYIGSLHRRKNICNLLKGFDIYKQNSQDNVKLLVIGSAMWCRDEYGGVLDKMQYKKDVINIKRLEPIELSKVLAASIALTYVSLFEGFGIPIVEAFYAETAVITSNVTSMPEVADDAALFCNPEDPKDIAEKMLDLARTPGLRHDLIEKGKIQRQKFNWDTTAEKLWQIIDSFRNKQTNDR